MRASDRTLRLLSPILFVGMWEVLTRFVVQSFFLVPPSRIAMSIWAWFQSGEVYAQITATVLAIAISFGLAVVVGVAIGTAMGVSRTLMNLSEPVVAGLYSTPLLALTPLFILGLGIGLESKIALIFFVVVFPVIINTTAGVKQVDSEHVEAVLAFGGSEWSVIRRVRLPSAIPYILASMKIGIARAVTAAFVAEQFGSQAGLGFSIAAAASTFNMERMWAAVVLLALIGVLGTGLMSQLEQLATPWRRDTAAE